ncbi:MAG: nucleotidyltransferase family protein [Rhodopila sp.]
MSIALLSACLSLALDPGHKDAVRAQFAAPGFDGLSLMALANAQKVSPALLPALRRHGIEDALPTDLAAYLALLLESNAARNRRLAAQCRAVGKILAAAGLEAVLLKGACWLFTGGAEAEDRLIVDIDLLLPHAAMSNAVAALVAAGYQDTTDQFEEPDHFHYAPLLPAPAPGGSLASLELHRDLGWQRHLLPAEEVLHAARPVASDLLLPSPEHRLLHNILHAQHQDAGWAGGVIRLRDLLDAARLLATGLDVGMLADWMHRHQKRHLLTGTLHLAHRLLAAPVPPPLHPSWPARLHTARCLAQARSRHAAWLGERLAILVRGFMWERDVYGMESNTGLLARHRQVMRRRWARIRRRTGLMQRDVTL